MSDPKITPELMNISVNTLNLSTRAKNCLDDAKIRTLGDLASWGQRDLLRLHRFGPTALLEVTIALKKIGLGLGMGGDLADMVRATGWPTGQAMTLRDNLAGRAMQGMLINPMYDENTREQVAKEAYAIADAMLLQREIGGQP